MQRLILTPLWKTAEKIQTLWFILSKTDISLQNLSSDCVGLMLKMWLHGLKGFHDLRFISHDVCKNVFSRNWQKLTEMLLSTYCKWNKLSWHTVLSICDHDDVAAKQFQWCLSPVMGGARSGFTIWLTVDNNNYDISHDDDEDDNLFTYRKGSIENTKNISKERANTNPSTWKN